MFQLLPKNHKENLGLLKFRQILLQRSFHDAFLFNLMNNYLSLEYLMIKITCFTNLHRHQIYFFQKENHFFFSVSLL
jgi:hypothetical protein